MKICLFTLVLVIAGIYSTAQTSSAIEWQKSFGGSISEFATSIKQTSDGGYIVAGNVLSDDGDVSGNHGNYDVWVLKLSGNGAIQWQKCLGGSEKDLAYSVALTSDQGYVIAGFTSSNNGNVSGNHGEEDVWVVKLTHSGAIQWQKCLGGSKDDEAYSIKQTPDEGYIIAGSTYSVNGNVSGNHGVGDDWIVKLNSSGNLEWQRCLGGSFDDGAFSIDLTTDGGYIVAGNCNSKDGDVSGNYGSLDIWVIKLNGSGTIQWQKNFGGSTVDYVGEIEQTSDGGYIMAGFSFSNDGDVSGNHGDQDVWVVKLTNSGAIQWQKCLGGSSGDEAWSIKQTPDNGYIIAGVTYSVNGNVYGSHGWSDDWIVRLNSSGDLQWQYCLGGSDQETAYSIEQTTDGGYIVAGEAASKNGDVTGNHGYSDFWVVKLKPDNILPVTMLALTGKAQGKQNLLDWTTVAEQNNTGFEVQRSSDGYNFSKIGFVNTKAVNGSSNLKLSYDFSDIGFAATANYYRLKQIDKDGKFAFSNIVLIREGNATVVGDVSIYPNPAKNIVNVKIASANNSNLKIYLTDMSGKTVLAKSVLGNGETIIQLDISHLHAGSYLVKIISGNGKENVVKKFVKE